MYEILRAMTIFRTLPDEALRELVPMLRQRRLPANKLLIQKGERATECYIILSGLCEVFTTTAEEEIKIASRTAGDLIGETTVIGGDPYAACVRCKTDVEVIVFNEQSLLFWLRRDPEAVLRLLKEVLKRGRQLSAKLEEKQATFIQAHHMITETDSTSPEKA